MSVRKPRIAMTTWRRMMPTFLNPQTDLYTLGAEYPAAVAAAGALVMLLPHHDPEDAEHVLQGFDGLVMVGGDDIHPSRYGASDRGVNKGVSDSADASDLAIAAAAVSVGIPFFAICRGYQALNVAMGGTLHQDITADDGLHRPISETPEDVLGERHKIEITPRSRLSSAYGGATSRIVNSIHHQAIERVATGFHPVAWADDGTIEAIEPDDASAAILAVQWHPEKIVDEGDHLLFDYFVRELVRR